MGGLTRCLAAVILLTHTLVAIVHMALIVWFGWSCRGLRSLCDVVIIVSNSSPNEILDNICAGTSRLDTYKHITKVREVSNT